MTIKLSTKNNLYKTSDLALATALSLFCPIKTLEKINAHKVYFIFKKDKGFEKLLDQYWRQELKVQPQAYFNQLKIIKARLYSE
jgi:hypothetical protein